MKDEICKERSVYEGDLKNDLRHGQGTVRYPNGNKYEGGFSEDKRHGKGKLTYSNFVYDGQWEKDQMHGSGKCTYSFGAVYDGQWEKDQKHGSGKCTYSFGAVYDGQWEKGHLHGSGKCTYSTGAVYHERWERGELRAELKLTGDECPQEPASFVDTPERKRGQAAAGQVDSDIEVTMERQYTPPPRRSDRIKKLQKLVTVNNANVAPEDLDQGTARKEEVVQAEQLPQNPIEETVVDVVSDLEAVNRVNENHFASSFDTPERKTTSKRNRIDDDLVSEQKTKKRVTTPPDAAVEMTAVHLVSDEEVVQAEPMPENLDEEVVVNAVCELLQDSDVNFVSLQEAVNAVNEDQSIPFNIDIQQLRAILNQRDEDFVIAECMVYGCL